MTYDVMARGALDYAPCKYGVSKLNFRGPKRRLDVPYVAFLGGTEFYGKFIKAPIPALVESNLGVNCVNFGQCNAGLDLFLRDPMLLPTASNSDATVLQVLGAHNMSNRMYTVHPRHNDRFVAPARQLRALYDDVDFAEFHYTKHMLKHLIDLCPTRFREVRAELEQAWVFRMISVLQQIEGKVVLLWMSDQAPAPRNTHSPIPDLSQTPLFVTREMLDEVAAYAHGLVETVISSQALAAGCDGMEYGEMDAPAAAQMYGPRAHGEAAAALSSSLQHLLGT
jgi:hypothetical protein